MRDARDLTHDELAAFVVGTMGAPRFRAGQVFRWLHARDAASFDDMTDVPRDLRARLAGALGLGSLRLAEVQTSRDGTRKLRLDTAEGRAIESVLIPDGDKLTQCISSQVGCALDCSFCATATLGFGRNLTAGEIVEQVLLARRLLAEIDPGRRITNLVYMGMGEPLHNYANVVRSVRILTDARGSDFSSRRITVSTAGLVSGIEKLGREDVRPNLAVSLNATTDEVRDVVMPINKKWNIAALVGAIRAYPLERRRRVTFEYVLLAGVNDTPADAARLCALLRGLPCKVNLIPWNPHPLAPYRRPTPAAIEAFQNEVKRLGLPAYLRTPRGDDIDAACGQLAARPRDVIALTPRPA
ncbi:MAG TPA: 23S rRNA (adenine(2503)-C(2))-methyltransferase RlmN [Haliangiales bacterium]|nr:23S rRNA (adenine(2503)-C(2))-methyltransferase RlmN [Haliangiales bacterium]